MSKASWYVHIQGENIGPLSTDSVSAMLQQNRLQFVDFIWSETLTKWHRIIDLDQFASLMPEYRKAGIPSAAQEPPPPRPSSSPERTQPLAESRPAQNKKTSPSPPTAKPKRPALGKFHRVLANGVKAHTKELGSFAVVNMSEGGIFLASDKPPYVGTEIVFLLDVPGIDKKMEMTGVVIRHGHAEETIGFAIEFIRLNPAHKRLLHDYIAERTKEQ